MKTIDCIVDSALPDDQGWGRIRLDPPAMQALEVSPGDIVKVTGTKSTVAKVWRALTPDWGLNKARIDKYARMNAGVKLGDHVIIEKITEQKQIEILTITPPKEIPRNLLTDETLDIPALSTYPVAVGDILPVRTFVLGNMPVEFKVAAIYPEDACLINKTTEFEMEDEAGSFATPDKITYEDIGGLKAEIARVREMIELPLRHPELFETMGIDSPKGVLLYGPPGTGKTLLAKAVANESKAHFISVAGPEIISKYYGESEQKLREVFEEARDKAPSVIFIDELDSIAPCREEATGEVERRVVAQLLTMLDGISERGQVIVIGATNRPDAVDPALRRPGRFDREIEIGVPSEADRLEILKIHTRNMPFEGRSARSTPAAQAKYGAEKTRILETLATLTKGYVGADLAYLAREAAISALRRQVDSATLELDKVPESVLKTLEVTKADFLSAAREITPSAMREISLETANAKWSDIGGLASAVRDVRESVEYPLTQKERFSELGIRPPKGVLLYGPPGTGKTLIAKAVANESGANFIAVKGPQLLSKWVGESEKAVRDMFKKARQVAPSVIFFDEIDSLTPPRGGGDSTQVTENVLNQILTEMDGIEELHDVVILAASNRPDIIDPALLRSGRFDRLVYIAPPSASDRKEIFAVHMRTMPIEGSLFDELAKELRGLSDDSVEVLGEKLAGKTRTAKQILASAKSLPKGEDRPVFEIRTALANAFAKNQVTFKDPVRTALIERLAEETEGFVGSDIEGICREAAMHALREGRGFVSGEDFSFAKGRVHPTMNEHVRKYYEGIEKSFKGGLPKETQRLVEYQ
ncbi:MAG TPA: CDC48 family AAA ATPase [Methanocorpusculum sp.]|nr:CDC48 family AAA ATPase [Methanocorpusculum sp.]